MDNSSDGVTCPWAKTILSAEETETLFYGCVVVRSLSFDPMVVRHLDVAERQREMCQSSRRAKERRD